MPTMHATSNRTESADFTNQHSDSVDTVVIMPVFAQAPFLGEALDDVLAQKTSANFKVVLVDDACPDPATVAACRKACSAMSDKVFYIRSRENKGLSNVRNIGVSYALERWPEVFSILFFDGDDRMHDHLIERSLCALRESVNDDNAEHKIGWVFEDGDHFGKDGLILRIHKYSALFSMAGCANTSSSMINADMFRGGLQYNETMVSGGEDWHFWLQALKNGFRGKFVPQLGFQYRLRPGSMAHRSLKAADKNRTSIRLSHPELFHPDFFLSEEQSEAPRYAVFTTDTQPNSIQQDRQITFPDLQSLVRDLLAYEKLPTHPVAQYVIFSTSNCLTDLDREGLLDWLLWQMELQANTSNIIAARILPATNDESIASFNLDISLNRQITDGSLFCVSTKWLLQLGGSQDATQKSAISENLSESIVSMTGVNAQPVYNEFEQFIEQFNTLYSTLCQSNSNHDFDTWKPFGIDRFDFSDHFFDATPLLPVANGKNEILCVIRQEEIENDDQLRQDVMEFASQCKAKDRICTLLTLGSCIDKPLASHFHRLLITQEKLNHHRMVAEAGDKALLGLLLPFGSVVSFGAMDYASDFNQLRRYGRKVFNVFTGRKNVDQLVNTDLINCFKVFTGVLCTDAKAEIRALALGVSEEQIVRQVPEVIDGARGFVATPE